MKTAQLTITKATSQARRIVDRVMPGVMATVESKHSWDAASDRQTVVTTITFPANAYAANNLALALQDRLGADVELSPTRIVVTRAVA